MSDPLNLGEKAFLESDLQTKEVLKSVLKNKVILIFAVLLIIVGVGTKALDSQPVFFAHAYASEKSESKKIESPLFAEKPQIFSEEGDIQVNSVKKEQKKPYAIIDGSSGQFAEKLYAIVEDAPIKEMVPFIAKRDKRTAAFLVAIAKKESSFGEHSPSLNGQDCYNYWGYKGSAGRGTSMGYACFASPEEAIQIVGDRIDVLVNKNRTTPASMVHTWKCGTNCSGDPGAPGWVSTVAMYFEKIVI